MNTIPTTPRIEAGRYLTREGAIAEVGGRATDGRLYGIAGPGRWLTHWTAEGIAGAGMDDLIRPATPEDLRAAGLSPVEGGEQC